MFREALPATLRDAIVFFDEDRDLPNGPVLSNVLLGRVAAAEAGAEARVRELVMAQLDAAELRRDVVLLVADVPTGSDGSLLPVTGRERVAMARALAKRPHLIVLNQVLGTSAMRNAIASCAGYASFLPMPR